MNTSFDKAPIPLYVSNTWPRIVALSVDGMVFGLIYGLFFLANQIRIDRTEFFISWIAVLGTASAVLLMQVFFLKKYSRTPGKMLMGLYIADFKSQRPGLSNRHIALRLLSGMLAVPLSMAPQSFALFRLDRRSIQDLVAGTHVLRDRPRKVPAKVRWLLGSILTVYCVWSGLSGLSAMKRYSFTREGMSVDLLAMALEMKK